MINKFTISGLIGNNYSYTALYCGHDLSRETYFFDNNPKGEKTAIRFFSKGSEMILSEEGLKHFGNGGYFCEYMFGDSSPISDLINPEVLNRLVLYGARHDEANRTLSFSAKTDGFVKFSELFRECNAVSNWFFFVSSKTSMEIIERQKWLLKNSGRFLKTTPLLSSKEHNPYPRLANRLMKKLPEDELHLLLIRVVNIPAKKYFDLVDENFEFDPLFTSPKWKERDSTISLDEHIKERIRLDAIYKHENNKKIVDTYKMLLVEAQKHKNLPQSAQNYIYRYKSLIKRKNLPPLICEHIEKKFPVKVKPDRSEDYIGEFKLVFSNLLFTEHSFREDLVKSDLRILLMAKHRAFLDNNKNFEQILIDLGKKLDEINDEALRIKQMDFFSRVVTYFDYYDSCTEAIANLALGRDGIMDKTKIRGLMKYYETFNGIEDKFFEKLFIEPIIEKQILSNYGIKKLNMLMLGFEEIRAGTGSEDDLIDSLNDLTREEDSYKKITQAIRKEASWKAFNYSSKDTVRELREKVLQKTPDIQVKGSLLHEIFNRALQDYNLEAIYFSETIPEMILTSSWEHRNEFMKTSGLDPLRIEEIEAMYCRKNNLSSNYLSSISSHKK